MSVTATELLRAVHAKRVVPDYPTATSKAQFLLENQLQLSREFIADRQPECSRRFQNSFDAASPLPRPLEVLRRVIRIAVNVVFISYIERRVRKNQVDRAGIDSPKAFDAVTLV